MAGLQNAYMWNTYYAKSISQLINYKQGFLKIFSEGHLTCILKAGENGVTQNSNCFNIIE
jgi:hypothetical protein